MKTDRMLAPVDTIGEAIDPALEPRRWTTRRAFGMGLFGLALPPLAGCMTKPLEPVRADGSYCHRTGKRYRPTLTCTVEPVPSLDVEAQAKMFEANRGALTLYVVRKRWGDVRNQVVTSFDGRRRVTTIPESLIRVRLKPGEHRLALEWEGSLSEFVVSGAAGEVRFVELVGSVWSWGSSYRWENGSLHSSLDRAISSRLIADLDMTG